MQHLYQGLVGSLLLLAALFSSAGAVATAIDLGTAARFTVLGGRGIVAAPSVQFFGDVAVTPALSSTLVGFNQTRTPFADHATSPLVAGKLFAPDFALDPTTLNQASADLIAAFEAGSSQSPPDFTVGGDLGGRTLLPGLYSFNAAVAWSTDVTLNGTCNDVFVFQVGGALGCAAGTKVILNGGLQAKNVFWVVNGAIVTGAASELSGIFLTNTAITIAAGNAIDGRLLAQTAITVATTVNVTEPTSESCSIIPELPVSSILASVTDQALNNINALLGIVLCWPLSSTTTTQQDP